MRTALNLAAAATLALLAGCAPQTTPPPPTGASVAQLAQTVSDADCATAARARTLPDEPGLAVVVDATASRGHTTLPDGTVGAMAEVGRAGGRITVVGVEGPDAPAQVLVHGVAVLDPELVDTPREEGALRTGLACVVRAVAGYTPTAPGSDPYAAVNAAVGMLTVRDGGRLEVVSDLWSTGGVVRLSQGVDPGETPVAPLAAQLAERGLARLDGLAVGFHGVGTFAGRPGDEAVTRWLEQLAADSATAAGAASVQVDRDGGTPVPGPVGPADPVALGAVQPAVVTAGSSHRLSGNAFFEPGSAALKPGTEERLADLAAQLAPRKGSRAEIVGHVASWGDERYRDQLSTARAAAIRDALVRLGADPAALSVRGAGSRERLAEDLAPDGTLLPAEAAQNRRVDVRVAAASP